MANYTEKAILKGFEEMLNEMSFSKITVSALISKCEISSNTFYYHYRDIYDLLDTWLDRKRDSFFLNCREMEDHFEMLKAFFRALKEHPKLEKTFERPNKVGDSEFGGFYGSYYYVKLSMALADGKYVCSTQFKGRNLMREDSLDEGFFDLGDLQGGTLVDKMKSSADFRSYKMGADKQNLYYMDIKNGDLSRFDYGTGDWVTVCEQTYGDAIDYRNGCFYIWGRDNIQIVRPSDGAHQTKIDLKKDVDVLDMQMLPTSRDNLFVTTDEQYLFYDTNAKAIQVIRANPEY